MNIDNFEIKENNFILGKEINYDELNDNYNSEIVIVLKNWIVTINLRNWAILIKLIALVNSINQMK